MNKISAEMKAWKEHDLDMNHHIDQDLIHFIEGYNVGDAGSFNRGQRAMVEKMQILLFKQKHGVRAALAKLAAEVG